jgi:PRTRC genetic system protein E
MFSELMPLIQHRPLTLTIAAVDEKQIRVNVIPGKIEKDKAANKEIGHSHSKEVAPIPESAIAGLTTPLSLTGTPDEIDAQLTKTLTEFTALHVGLQNSFDAAAGAIAKAVKEIDDRERIKKEQDKAKNKKSEPAKAEPKNPEPEPLPSLFAPPAAQTAVSANDSTTAGGGS